MLIHQYFQISQFEVRFEYADKVILRLLNENVSTGGGQQEGKMIKNDE
jgi:hypothetical protein